VPNITYRLPADVLHDVMHVVDVDSVKVDARDRARVRDAVEYRRHAAAGATPVRPEVDESNAVPVDLYKAAKARRDEGRDMRDDIW
jgi:hypothetical protein